MSNPFTPAAFVAKWKRAKLSERAASQEHFLDLCRLLAQPTPAEHDATGAEYTFEKGITITQAAANSPREGGFADVWWNGKFGWEYKRKDKHKSLDEAYAQLQRYREALNNPPLLIASDISRIQIHTNFNNTANETVEITLDDIADGPGVDKLRHVFTNPEFFRPKKTTEEVTLEVAAAIGKIAQRLQKQGNDPHAVAHYLMKCMFCLFAEKVPGLLPERLFKNLLNRNRQEPERFKKLASDLFKAMASGGDFGADQIPYFNGGLFDDAPPIEFSSDDLGVLNLAANHDWAHIEPSILGTLFERSLDPSKRAQIGAHYTSKEDILLVIDPVIMQPLRREWQKLKSSIESQLTATGAPDGNPGLSPANTKTSRSGKTTTQIFPLNAIHQQILQFLAKLSSLKILDPACGSGNFLYVAIQQLLTLEKEIITFAAQPPISLRLLPRIRPTQLLGIEINPYAAELAQISIWIGFLQWLHLNGFPVAADTPILSKLQTIENRDAILDFSGNQSRDRQGATNVAQPPPAVILPTPARWPNAHFIIGNPPFLGSKLFRAHGLSDDYLKSLYHAFDLPKTSDLCCYWFELARQKIDQAHATQAHGFHAVGATDAPPRNRPAKAKSSPVPDISNPEISNPQISSQEIPNPFPEISLPRAGLLATQGIRGGDNRTVLQRIKKSGDIFMAWSDKQWFLDGAMVHTSIVAFDSGAQKQRLLDGIMASSINSDLSSYIDVTTARQLRENLNIAFMGDTKGGPFEMGYQQARRMIGLPNPHRQSNAAVMRPWINGSDLAQRNRGLWIIDFGCNMPIEEASLFKAPFRLIEATVKNERVKNRRETYAQKWWIHVEPRPALREHIDLLSRFLVTTRVAKHRLFEWFENPVLVDSATFAFARSDDYFFGVLHSSIHEIWARRTATQLREEESGTRYTPSTCFETFVMPWPLGEEPTKDSTYKRIAEAAKELATYRHNDLNPPNQLDPLARILDAQDDFSDVPAEARALIRHSALMAEAAKSPNLKKRTLTNLYNERPTWLKLAHEKLDRAVLAAYASIDPEGKWSEDWAALYTQTGAGQPLPKDHPQAAQRAEVDQKILTNLLRLNHQRAANQQAKDH